MYASISHLNRRLLASGSNVLEKTNGKDKIQNAEIKLRKDEWERNDYFPINASQYQDSAVKFYF